MGKLHKEGLLNTSGILWKTLVTLRRKKPVRHLEQTIKYHWRPGPIATLRERRFVEELRRLQKEISHKGIFVFVGTIAWHHTLFQRPQQLALALSRLGYLVFYCDPPWNLRTPSGIWPLEPKLFLCRIPFSAFRAVKRPVVYLSLATNKRFMQHFSEARVVYDCIDELEIFESYEEKRLVLDHNSLLRESDLVVASSDRLADQVRALHSDVLLCPNGVDHCFFARCLSEKFPVPVELKPLLDQNIPLAGYYGALANWVDYELLIKVARAFPSWAIVVIGPDHDGSLPRSRLLKESNVYWLGSKPYSLLPNYLQSLSVTMIPFQINSLTLSASPIKLLEYLAAGKAVVSVDLPECRKYAGALVAKDGDAFVELLARAQRSCGDSRAQEVRSQAVFSEDWKQRAQSIAAALEPYHVKS